MVRIWGVLADLCAWGVGFRGWIRVLYAGAQEDAYILSHTKVSIGVSSRVEIVITGDVYTPYH